MSPRVLKIDLSENGYYMEVDVNKDECKRENAHWHLCKDGKQIGRIDVPRCVWRILPDEYPRCVIEEAGNLTRLHAEEIQSIFEFNRLNGVS